MLAIFYDMIKESVEVFMDDFSIFGNSFDNCLHNLDKMLKRCKNASLFLIWEKCHFMVKEGIVLGHKVSGAGLEVNKKNRRPTSGIRATKGTLHKIEHRSKPFIPPNQIIMSANDNFSLHDDEELSLHDDASLDGSVPASNKGDAPAKPPQIHFQTLNCPFSKKMIMIRGR
ncbi:hypothetical protein Tco_1404171 [Tanacetum coccineum]